MNTDPAAPAVRPTKDVDVVVEVATRAALDEFEQRVEARGFKRDQQSGVICRWVHRGSGLVLDVIPAETRLLGFENEWLKKSVPHAIPRTLPSGAGLRAIPPPYLLATKLEAFRRRGRGDFLASADFADVIAVVDGREEVVSEVASAPSEVRSFLARELASLARETGFHDGIASALRPDAASQARVDDIVVPRLRELFEPAV